MAEVFSRQHRIFGFSLFIRDDMARFIRWDRAGVIVSAQFNYHEDSKPLVKFFWRFSHLTDQQRGHDPNVRLAKESEIELAKEKLSKWKPEKEKQPFVVFTVPGEDKKPREFIAWNPMAAPYTVTGRCTRAYPVYEKATDKCYFLKDLWRAHDLSPEADILRKLAEKEVEHVPKFLCGGDIDGENTKTDIYALDETASPWLVGDNWSRITPRIHHRFVVDFIGKPLSTVENSKQLMQVVSDAYTGCQQAYTKCDYVHRDISGRNILIDENGRGVLNDWDLAKHKDPGESRRHERTGTWQFMSYLLLSGHHDAHTIQDDMESFFYVMLYFGLRYLQHNYARRVPSLLKFIFDYEDFDKNGSAIGGVGKGSLIMNSDIALGDNFKFSSGPFQRWFEWSIKAIGEWIRHCKLTTSQRAEATQGAESKLLFYDHSNMAKMNRAPLTQLQGLMVVRQEFRSARSTANM
ncbi:hypothetical protein C0993_011410 [Termitomyces sp. T159_Od127]|nr:hypothetical protein C0993_011410 [Termitomyces sp. T159_Od127]